MPGRERIEWPRIEFRPQPGQLALGQLARGEDRAITQLRGVELALQVLRLSNQTQRLKRKNLNVE